MLVIMSCVALLLMAQEACADFYRYINKDGLECYTDSPVSKKAVLVLKEPRKGSVKSNSRPSPLLPPLFRAHTSSNAPKPVSRDSKSSRLPVEGRITSGIGLRYDPIDGTLRNHNGLDIAVPEGTPVQSVSRGVVSYSGARNGYGNLVIIEHDDGTTTLYAHNREITVSAGQRVEKRSVIAYSGSTGRSTGPHLHFEAWYGRENITSE
ncbi:MAG: M23 family metallopeptidase, partial [Geobacteraceae bacterium]|nr:M23 family metallopeptidase [Geobacteraceae bacterium]